MPAASRAIASMEGFRQAPAGFPANGFIEPSRLRFMRPVSGRGAGLLLAPVARSTPVWFGCPARGIPRPRCRIHDRNAQRGGTRLFERRRLLKVAAALITAVEGRIDQKSRVVGTGSFCPWHD